MGTDWEQVLFGSFFFLLLAGVLYSTWRTMQSRDRRWRRQRVRDGFAISSRKPVRSEERRFRKQFPELQPFFHPEKAILFVREHRRFKPKSEAVARRRWMPAGFNSWALVTENPGEKVQRLQLRSWRNSLRASFVYKATSDGAILGIGDGEMTVVDSKDNPHVHYRHPRRQFRWSAKKGWRVGRPAEERRDRVDHGYVDEGPTAASRAAAGAAVAAAVIAGQGGEFDGGGSSQSWDSAAGEGDASDSWESAADSDDGSDSDDTSTD